MGAISIECFMDPGEYRGRAAQIAREMKWAELAQGFERIYLPGEREFEIEERYRAVGIPPVKGVHEELRELQGRFSLHARLA